MWQDARYPDREGIGLIREPCPPADDVHCVRLLTSAAVSVPHPRFRADRRCDRGHGADGAAAWVAGDARQPARLCAHRGEAAESAAWDGDLHGSRPTKTTGVLCSFAAADSALTASRGKPVMFS